MVLIALNIGILAASWQFGNAVRRNITREMWGILDLRRRRLIGTPDEGTLFDRVFWGDLYRLEHG